jgi:hypothetical protein
MLTQEELRKIISSQVENIKSSKEWIKRDSFGDINLNSKFATIISGIRRCGKSTLAEQIIKKSDKFYYFNFEDIRVSNFEVTDFERLDNAFYDEIGATDYYFFDEIQNVPKWELYVRTLLNKNKKIIVTGSNASLLSQELGTKLTGRNLRYELFPFSFKEFCSFKKIKPNLESFKQYFTLGGFPEYLKGENKKMLQDLLFDILNRDIISRYGIKNSTELKNLTNYLLTNISKTFSYNNLKKTLGLKSINSVISFVSYLENSYLIFTIPKFDYSLKKQLVNPKKVYAIDLGLVRVNSSSFSEDYGRLLENQVFLGLRRKTKEIFYFQDKKECDFVVKKGSDIISAIQVCYKLDSENKGREIEGLIEAMSMFKLKEGLILTLDQEEEMKIKDKKIIIQPVWKWLLKEE